MAQKILLIEPDLFLQAIYRTALERSGFDVVSVQTAQAAIFAAEKYKPDLVILEVQLEGNSGIEFLHEFRSYIDWQQTPIIMNTNLSLKSVNIKEDILENIGVARYCYKPNTNIGQLTDFAIETLGE